MSGQQGNIAAQCQLGICYRDGDGVKINLKESYRWFLPSANGGNAVAQCNVGDMYLNGLGVDVNPVEAVKYYTMAAEQNDADGQCRYKQNSDDED